VVFPIGPGDLTAGAGSTVNALATATELRIFHSTTAMFPGEAIVASLGVDNITAQAIPESSSVLTLGLIAGLVGLVTWWARD
jgi:hypothetical protein